MQTVWPKRNEQSFTDFLDLLQLAPMADRKMEKFILQVEPNCGLVMFPDAGGHK